MQAVFLAFGVLLWQRNSTTKGPGIGTTAFWIALGVYVGIKTILEKMLCLQRHF